MTNRPPSWADLNVAPTPRPSKRKILAIGCGTLFAGTMGLAVLGAIVGPPPKTQTSAAGVASAAPSATPRASAAPTIAKASPKQSTSPVPTTTAPAPSAKPTPKPTPPPPRVDLVLSSGLTGSVTQADDVLPIKTSESQDLADLGYYPPDGATQCIIPTDSGASWSATVTFHVNNVKWSMTIGEPNLGLPTAGSHPGGSDHPGDIPNVLILDVGTDKNPLTGAPDYSGGTYSFPLGPAGDRNTTITVNSNMTSGTIDAWLGPVRAIDGDWEFHLTGRWSCR